MTGKGLDLPQALTGFQSPGDHALPDYRWGKSLSRNQRPQGFDEVMHALARNIATPQTGTGYRFNEIMQPLAPLRSAPAGQ